MRKEIVDLLDVQVRLIREDGGATAYVTCVLCDAVLELSVSYHADLFAVLAEFCKQLHLSAMAYQTILLVRIWHATTA